MKIGMTLPVTEPGWDRNVVLEWARRIEGGPFHSLALGERNAFPTPDIIISITGSGPPIDFDASAMAGLPTGAQLWFQSAFLDPNAANGVSLTDGLQAIVP